ncbi:FAD-dependent monooxygenase [Chelatococcus asaccharovorans]|uniref:2-polyprenyl-6-methoxyphenol hydroxylase-like FAD-dependent oxidoreductase n=2 Tax=Chelatococcus asaccharovorans TaxID=28210 RepID=A0A2V3U0Z0_9HYPH|nr:FAD-dependent monooxygenase [Chelatococcus asaccharovorans]MBS7707776.1 FAD-dependent monooxygenase [Chelatococcus asaccharovorans]PXW55073.1 2-polyprenyl-6-methoxyphenol hydroxylase-like FAD-dependent oxidoreductase [Chelatococcus asaccharovorans]
MKIKVIGAGPAGLYFALLAKKRLPHCEIEVFEQNPCDATYGFGIVLADRGLSRMERADPDSFARLSAAMYVTRHQILRHREDSVFIEGVAFGGAVPRLRLLNILQDCCEEAGVQVHYERRVEANALDADMIVGADGINSLVRAGNEAAFGATTRTLSSRMAWYGTKRHFPYPVLVFRKAGQGHFIAVAYPYSEAMSTVVIECDAATWQRCGLAAMSDRERQTLAERIFEPELRGEPLLSNHSIWRNLPVIRCSRWHAGNTVLIGDALHSAHPSIGSGTRIAMEDSIALADALKDHPDDVQATFRAFEAIRAPQKQKMLDATEGSFTWYETFPDRMARLGPVDLVFDYLQRTGRISDERLSQEFPRFVDRYGTFSDRRLETVGA